MSKGHPCPRCSEECFCASPNKGCEHDCSESSTWDTRFSGHGRAEYEWSAMSGWLMSIAALISMVAAVLIWMAG